MSDSDEKDQSGSTRAPDERDTLRDVDFADLLESDTAASSALGPRPSFFPDETPAESRAFADQLLPSLPPAPTKSHAFSTDSGLYATSGMRTSEDGAASDDISTVVLVHAREEIDAARGAARPGLMSALLGQERALADEGAIAAWRTVPLRRRRELKPAARLRPGATDRERAALLLHLAEHGSGEPRAQLLLGAGELLERLSEHDSARAAYEAAAHAAPREPLVLERRLQAALRARQLETVEKLLLEQSALPIPAPQRALALAALAESLLARGAEPDALAMLERAREIHPTSFVPQLLRAERLHKLGHAQEAAVALRAAADATEDPELRAALLVQAGRHSELAGEPNEALSAYARASAASPRSRPAALGAYRVCRAQKQWEAAEAALAALANACDDPRLRSELARRRARLLHETLDRPEEALAVLASVEVDGVLGLRQLAHAAEAAGHDELRTRALARLSRSSFGNERALALFELATSHAARGEHAEAEAALYEAAVAGAPRSLLGLLRERLARATDDAAELSQAALDADAADTLRAAAKLAATPAETARELELLARACTTEGENLGAEALAIDAAAELADLPRLQALLLRSAGRLSPEARSGPLLALLDLLGDQPPALEVLEQLLASARGATLAVHRLHRHERDPARVAAAWLAEAARCERERAAFAATMVGRYLEDAGAEPDEAYLEALDAVRGYPAAAYALEAFARGRGDVLALERVHRELAATTPSASERATRYVRLSLLAAESDAKEALGLLDRASEEHVGEVLLADLALRMAAELPAPVRSERLKDAANLEHDQALRRALQLRAASACEDAGRLDEAIAAYEGVLREPASDTAATFAELGLREAARCARRYEELIARSERALFAASSPETGRSALEALAELELLRGEPGRACVALETLLETELPAVSRVVILRTLERLAEDDDDRERVSYFAAHLASCLDDERDRAAELRLALRDGSGLDQTRADEYLLRAEGTITRDLWFALSLEALAVRTSDRARYYDATRAIADSLSEPTEQAAYALRAAESFEAAAPSRAASDLEGLLLAAPEHPLAVEELARLYRAANDPERAAATFLRAADSAPSPRRKVQLLYHAGVILQDELADRDAALAALLRVVDLDVHYADAVARAQSLFAARGDAHGALGLLDRRLSQGPEPALAAELHRERARLYEQLGDRVAAVAALGEAAAADPLHAPTLRSLAERRLQDGAHREAADALVQLARVTEDPETLAYAFHELGVLYDGPLPDPRRAEIAFTRVVALAPSDPRPVERLVSLWRKRNEHARAARALEHLAAQTSDVARREGYLVELSLVQAAMGDERAAEKTLEDARHAAPASVVLLAALSVLYARQNDRTALAMHLTRSCHSLRAAIEANADDAGLWQGLVDMLTQRERPDGAALVADAARAFGVVLTRAPAAAQLRGLGSEVRSDVVRRKLSPRGPLDATRTFLRALSPALAAALPPKHAYDPEPLAEGSRVLRAVAELFDSPQLTLLGTADAVCLPIADAPPTLLVPARVLETASEPQLFFLLARAAAVASEGLSTLVRCDPERALLFVHALLLLDDPKHAVAAIDVDALAALHAELSAVLTPDDKATLAPRLAELLAEGDWNPRRLAAQALELGTRVALAASADFASAFEALLLLRGEAPGALGPAERAALVKRDPQLRALLSFALSEAYLEVRREHASRSSRPPRG